LEVVIVLAMVFLAINFSDQWLRFFCFIVLLVLNTETTVMAKQYKKQFVFLATTFKDFMDQSFIILLFLALLQPSPTTAPLTINSLQNSS